MNFRHYPKDKTSVAQERQSHSEVKMGDDMYHRLII